MVASRRSRRARYRRYTGGDPLAPPVDLSEALSHIGDDVMAGYSPERAMQEFLRRGGQDQLGLDDLARQLAQRRQELLQRYSLDGTLQQVRELLDEAVLEERKQLARDVDMDDVDRAFRQLQLDNLPASAAAAVTELSSYDWASAPARQKFEEIKDLLGRELLDQRFAGMKQALENATEADRQAINEMLADLNEMLEKHRRGEATEADFAEFMAKHGQFFPENPESIDELLDTLAQRAAAAQRLLNSMSPEQRAELMELSAQAFGSPELAESMARLDANLQSLRPGEDWYGSEEFGGGQGVGLGDGTGVLQDIAQLDALTEQLSQAYAGARTADIDLEALERYLGEDAAVAARTLQEIEEALRETGYLKRTSDGDLRLSPKAMRQLGRSLLRDVADKLSTRAGQRDIAAAGSAGERSGATRPWEFGDTQAWDIPRTITNAIIRQAGEGEFRVEPGTTPQVRLTIEDVEIQETEARTQAAVVLLVDTSFSMVMDNRWIPMKRTALALHQLITTRFRGDSLQLIAFGRYARTMNVEQLTGLDPYYDKGTNLHHGLLLAQRHFRQHPNAQPVLLIVTDGEPTAHLEPHGRTYFNYPPHPHTIALTVQELETLGRMGAQTTFFRLGEDPGLARFIDQLARRVEGRVVAPELDDLGAAVVGSYLGARGPASRGGGGGIADDLFSRGWGRGFWVG